MSKGAGLNSLKSNNETPLMLAFFSNRSRVSEYLLENNAVFHPYTLKSICRDIINKNV